MYRPATGALKFTKKGMYFSWQGITGLVVTVLSTGLMSGGMIHQSLFGSSEELVERIRLVEKTSLDAAQEIKMLEQRVYANERQATEREVHMREDMHEIKIMIEHLGDKIK
jgi:hypothetical protein